MTNGEGRKILVADADPQWRSIVAGICKSQGLDVVEAASLQEAEVSMGSAIYAVFIDIAQEELRTLANKAKESVPRIFLTVVSGSTDPSFKAEVSEYALQLVKKDMRTIQRSILQELAGLGLLSAAV
ncbi:MAG: hypothetical protein HZA34_02450 [Candidatus Pacebacteria bacterium]|nr:hypothetical protein [Candidatus Paceibacterota bacterium]